MDISSGNISDDNVPIKRTRVRRKNASNSDNTSRTPRKNTKNPNSKRVLKETKISTTFDIPEYLGFTGDIHDYFAKLTEGKEYTTEELAAIKVKLELLEWRINSDYEHQKFLDYTKKVKPVDNLSPILISPKSNLFNDF